MNTAIYFILLAIIALITWGIIIFNRFVRRRQLVKEGWSGIDVQLKRRTDLIPNLIETVKGYKAYEKDVLERVVDLRNQSIAADTVEKQGEIEEKLSGELGKLFALSENYPELKASKVYLDLQRQLSEIEDNIQMARRYYNGTVRDLNILVESFPSNLVASVFNIGRAVYFQLDDPAEGKHIAVDLGR